MVPQDILIRRVSEELRKMSQITPQAWTEYVKTGSHRERPPQDKDWWYTRSASVLRKIYLHGPIGLSDLETEYGGGKRVKFGKSHQRDAGQSAIRKPIQQLEAAGLVAKKGLQGRVVSSKGMSLLDKLSSEIFIDLKKENPSLGRYG
jgi:small subunit ribosomal protein S19e